MIPAAFDYAAPATVREVLALLRERAGDALRGTSTRHLDMPLLPEKVWRALAEG